MKKLLLLFLLVLSGCDTSPPPPPTIHIEVSEASGGSILTVYFDNHPIDQRRSAYLVLRSKEEIDAYQKEIEFLLVKLREAREKIPQD